MNERKSELLRRVEALQTRLERLLYDYDPDGMGSTVFAPSDEYSDVATSLIRALRQRDINVDLADVVWGIVPGATTDLVREIELVWDELAVS